jgi:hypothetical protein
MAQQGAAIRAVALTSCLEGRFTQGVNLGEPRAEVVRGARRLPLVTAVSRLFWHGYGTTGDHVRDVVRQSVLHPRCDR